MRGNSKYRYKYIVTYSTEIEVTARDQNDADERVKRLWEEFYADEIPEVLCDDFGTRLGLPCVYLEKSGSRQVNVTDEEKL